jgi:hypothetical protein
MVGELAREGGLLWITFGLLDWLLSGTSKSWTTASWLGMVLIVGLGLMVGGVVIERVR